MTDDERPFLHEKNLNVGRGRILYDNTGGIKRGKWCPPGWCLPGGGRTSSYETAYRAAEFIDCELSKPRAGGTGRCTRRINPSNQQKSESTPDG